MSTLISVISGVPKPYALILGGLDTFRRPLPGQDLLWHIATMPLAASLSAILLGCVIRAATTLRAGIACRPNA
jgi:hypothetical protein